MTARCELPNPQKRSASSPGFGNPARAELQQRLERFLQQSLHQEITMNYLNLPDLLLAMTLSLFLMGAVTFLSGVLVLLTRTMGRDVREITAQTRKLAQKGLAQELSGLVGNASALLNATTQMVRTTAGLGTLLVFMGFIQLTASIGLALYLYGG